MTQPRNKWTIDKHVNISIVFALFMNFSALIWGASKLDSRVGYLESSQVDEAIKSEKVFDRLRSVEVSVIRMESKLDLAIAEKGDRR